MSHLLSSIHIEANMKLYNPLLQIYSLRLTLISGMVEEEEEDIMGMDKDMKTIAMLQLPKTLTCSTVAMVGMGTTNNQDRSSHRSNKEEGICR